MPIMARTFALNVLYNWARDIFKTPAGFENEVLSICCIVKTMTGWNCERAASVGRERCGGMGFLANARFADYLATAHAALTAEGDNRVLMTKIMKDMITNVTKNGMKLPQPKLNIKTQISTFNDVSQLETLADLMRFRQTSLYLKLTRRMAELGKIGKTQYQIMMREVSDTIQDLAMAYGERLAIE
jgi:acyl-CoA oxidase